jgi:Domain of unknown function (DUF3067)
VPKQRAAHYDRCPSGHRVPERGLTSWRNMLLSLPPVCSIPPSSPLSDHAAPYTPAPLRYEEVIELLRSRWQASYDLQLVQRRGRLYLQVMWAYLEQQSFPLDAAGYEARLRELVEVLNNLRVAEQVRRWLSTTKDRPRLGKAMSLVLQPPADGRSSEFLL